MADGEPIKIIIPPGQLRTFRVTFPDGHQEVVKLILAWKLPWAKSYIDNHYKCQGVNND